MLVAQQPQKQKSKEKYSKSFKVLAGVPHFKV
jgi:hypothetical protein